MQTFTTRINQGGEIIFETFGTDAQCFWYGIKSATPTDDREVSVLIEAKTFDAKGEWHTVGGIDTVLTSVNVQDTLDAVTDIVAGRGVRFEATIFI